MVSEQGRPSREVAAELGICIDTLRSRLKASGITPGTADRQNRDSKRLRELEAENRSLRKQLTQKDGVIDVLKKSVGILWCSPFGFTCFVVAHGSCPLSFPFISNVFCPSIRVGGIGFYFLFEIFLSA